MIIIKSIPGGCIIHMCNKYLVVTCCYIYIYIIIIYMYIYILHTHIYIYTYIYIYIYHELVLGMQNYGQDWGFARNEMINILRRLISPRRRIVLWRWYICALVCPKTNFQKNQSEKMNPLRTSCVWQTIIFYNLCKLCMKLYIARCLSSWCSLPKWSLRA